MRRKTWTIAAAVLVGLALWMAARGPRPGQTDRPPSAAEPDAPALLVPQQSTYGLELVDAATQAPITDAHVGLLVVFPRESSWPTTVTSAGPGEYELRVVLPSPGEQYALLVERSGSETLALGGRRFEPGETHDFGVVPLTRPGTTLIRVFEERGGAPVAGTWVEVQYDDHSGGCGNAVMRADWPARLVLPKNWHGVTGADGTARAEVSRGEHYWVSVTDDAWADLYTDPEPPAELEVYILHGGAVTVRCLDARTLAPLAGETIACEADPGEWYPGADLFLATDAEGRARFERLAPGPYRFWSVEQGVVDAELVDVADGDEVELRLLRRVLEVR